MTVEIVFQNEHFIAVDKPSGWLSVPSRRGQDEERPCLTYELRRDRGDVFPVHRLDFEVSGLILFARNAKAHAAANAWFESRAVHKTYHALTGTAENLEHYKGEWVLWESKILRGKKRAYEKPFGKLAQTRVRILQQGLLFGEEALLWELCPLTGRSHQLRFELAKHGFPILNDLLYGGKPCQHAGIFLRSIQLDLSQCSHRELFSLPNVLQVEGLSQVIG